MTKALGCEALASEEVRRTAGLAEDALPQQEVQIRGRDEPMLVRMIADARELGPLVDQLDLAAA
jgi:adenylate cyclase